MGMGFVRLAEGQNGLRANFSSVRIIDCHVRRLGDEGRERKVARIQLNYRPGARPGQRWCEAESSLLDWTAANLHFPAGDIFGMSQVRAVLRGFSVAVNVQ